MSRKDEQAKAKREKAPEYRCHCPICAFMERLSTRKERTEEFWKHMDNAKVEFLQAFRSLIDRRIQKVKSRWESAQGASKIPVEEEA